jgi:hypothetical protein
MRLFRAIYALLEIFPASPIWHDVLALLPALPALFFFFKAVGQGGAGAHQFMCGRGSETKGGGKRHAGGYYPPSVKSFLDDERELLKEGTGVSR